MQGTPPGNTHAGTATHELADGLQPPALYQMEMPISNTAQRLHDHRGTGKSRNLYNVRFYSGSQRSCEALQEEQ